MLLGVVLAACTGAATSTYFDQPSSNGESGAVTPGIHAFTGVGGILEVRPGDRVRFLAVEAGGDVTRVRIGVLDSVSGGVFGVARANEMSPGDLAGYETLSDREFSSADGPLTILLEVTMPSHDVNIVAPVVAFSVNEGPSQHERLLTSVRLCARPSEADACDTPDPPAR